MDVNICQTCLSVDRRHISLKTVHSLIQEINLYEIKHNDGGICWECYKIISKFSKFKSQVKSAQDSLKLNINLKQCFSNLSVQSKNSYDYHFYHQSDPLTGSEVSKTEIHIVKVEHQDSDNNNYDDEEEINEIIYDKKPNIDDCVNVYVDSLDIKPNVADKHSSQTNVNTKTVDSLENGRISSLHDERLPKKLNKNTTEKFKYKNKRKVVKQDLNVKNKFTKVCFTVEEMLKNREEKRNRPNFKKILFKCDDCLIGFTKTDKFEEHVKKKHDDNIGPYICDVCKVRFAFKAAIEKHCQTHFTVYVCKLCKFESVQLWQTYNHCEARHGEDDVDNIHCQQCSAVVRTPEELDKHMATLHVIYCTECGEKFKNKSTLRKHKMFLLNPRTCMMKKTPISKSHIHGVKREFVCTICNKTFMKASRLETHIANHNDSLAQQLSYCAVCNIQYKSVQVYRSHLRQSAAHSPEQHPCPECNKKFSSKVYLTKHYNFYHLKKSQFKCELCNKLFISDWRLKNHKQKHHGFSRNRNHPCNVCGKKFFTLSTLRGHQLTHSEQRTFMCEDCGDTFKQRPALYTHTKLVHKGVKRKQ